MMGFKVLVVEDHEAWRNELKEDINVALRGIGQTDNTVELIEHFDKAYEALRVSHWDLLVTDIGLGGPGESQQKKGKRLVELAHRRKIPSIVVSGTPVVTKQDVRDFFKKHGASDYFSKPEFDDEQFIVKVQELLENPILIQKDPLVGNPGTYTSDVFICHASEDKRQVVEPLVDALIRANISCWYDEAEIKWGDSITQKVSEGLKISRFVIVILSKSFLEKKFPRNELYSALGSEIHSTEVKILPIVFASTNKEKEDILREMPLIANKLYLTWNGHANQVVQALQERLPEKKSP
jgi:CheY-like chemotaxis protein